MKFSILFLLLLPCCLKAQPPISSKDFAVNQGLASITIFRVDVEDTTHLTDTVKKKHSVIHFDHKGRIAQLSNGYNTNHYAYNEQGKVIEVKTTFKENSRGLVKYEALKNKFGGYTYNRYQNTNELTFQVITNKDDIILKIRQLVSSSGSVYDSSIRVYNPRLFYDSIIYYKSGKRLHQFHEQWFVENGVPIKFRKGFDQFSPGKGRGKTYSVTLEVDSTGTPIYPPKKGNRFSASEHDFYEHTPKYTGEIEPWQDKRILNGWRQQSPWHRQPSFTVSNTFYRFEYEYTER